MTNKEIVDYVMKTPRNTNPSVLNSLLQQRGGGSSVQPDWNQNDSTQADYIKNRPFYEYTEGKNEFLVEPIQLQVIYGTLENPPSIKIDPIKFQVGNIIQVKWNDRVYETTVREHRYTLFNYIGDWEGISDEPFYIYDEYGDGNLNLNLSSNFDYTFTGIIEFAMGALATEKIIQLDEKFLPIDKIGTQSDWKENNETSKAFIKNKPFGMISEGQYVIEPMVLTFEAGVADPVQDLSEFYLEEYGSYYINWDGNIYRIAYNYNYWGDVYEYIGDELPFQLVSKNPLTIKRFPSGSIVDIEFSVMTSLPKYNEISDGYLPKFTGSKEQRISKPGLVPAPKTLGEDMILFSNGTWGYIPAQQFKLIEGVRDTVISSLITEPGLYFLKGPFFRQGRSTNPEDILFNFEVPTFAICKKDKNDNLLLYTFDLSNLESEGRLYNVYDLSSIPVYLVDAPQPVERYEKIRAKEAQLDSFYLIADDNSKRFKITINNQGQLNATEVDY